MKKKIKWVQKITKGREDSNWYGGQIVEVETKKYLMSIEAVGDIAVLIDEEYYCDKGNNGLLAEYLEEHNIHNDKELEKAIEDGRVEFENNNWFEIFVWDKENKEWIGVGDSVIDCMEENDDFSWVDDWLEENELA